MIDRKEFTVGYLIKEEKGGPGSGSWDGPGKPRFARGGNNDDGKNTARNAGSNAINSKLPSFVKMNYVLDSVKKRQIEIEDNGGVGSGSMFTGEIRSGRNKGKFGAFIESFDFGVEFTSKKLYGTEKEINSTLNFNKITYGKLTELFTRVL